MHVSKTYLELGAPHPKFLWLEKKRKRKWNKLELAFFVSILNEIEGEKKESPGQEKVLPKKES